MFYLTVIGDFYVRKFNRRFDLLTLYYVKGLTDLNKAFLRYKTNICDMHLLQILFHRSFVFCIRYTMFRVCGDIKRKLYDEKKKP